MGHLPEVANRGLRDPSAAVRVIAMAHGKERCAPDNIDFGFDFYWRRKDSMKLLDMLLGRPLATEEDKAERIGPAEAFLYLGSMP